MRMFQALNTTQKSPQLFNLHEKAPTILGVCTQGGLYIKVWRNVA